jgi:altronate hydrolase
MGGTIMNRVLQLSPEDNVLVALTDLARGETIAAGAGVCTLTQAVPAKHKFTTRPLAPGDAIVMYGVLVGRATRPIGAGELLTTANVQHDAADFRATSGQYRWTAPDVESWREKTFLGYRRPGGQFGTRNYWLVAPLVFCENRNVAALKQAFQEELGFAAPQPYRQQVAQLAQLYREGRGAEMECYCATEPRSVSSRSELFPNLDGIKFLLHEQGCGGTREDAVNLCGLLAGYIQHPNVAGATVLSLGCQGSQVEILREQIAAHQARSSKPLLIFDQQRSGREFDMLSEAVRATFLGLVEANRCVREPAPLSKLCLALKCGGSDGFSGISANPAVGRASDLLVALGGRSILAEFPELVGVEQCLIERCSNQNVAERFVTLMHDYADRARFVRASFDMNPSPGNIRDGLLTDAMKSAGAAKKAGSSPINAVLDYPGRATEPGLNLLCTPGSDVEAVTAQVGAGATLVLFTTGLGTPTGNPIAPVLKIATNSALARRMDDIIDVDAGPIVTGEKTIEQTGDEILELSRLVASGEVRTKAEVRGQDDFIPWRRGVSL